VHSDCRFAWMVAVRQASAITGCQFHDFPKPNCSSLFRRETVLSARGRITFSGVAAWGSFSLTPTAG